MTTFVFPGQGSQRIGMGKDLFNHYPELIQQADEILGYSVKTLCLEDPKQQLNQTQYTQPALYIINVLSYLKKIEDNAVIPHYVAGHSLGEYNALFAAHVFDFATGLQLVQKRGALMSEASHGGMTAIIGLNDIQVENILFENKLTKTKIANYNSYTQIVISGAKEEIEQSVSLFEKAGATMVIPLKVSGAFHSIFMQPAREKFNAYIQNFTFNLPQVPIIANINAKQYENNTTCIANNLVEQITNPVRWTETINYLSGVGETEFVEVGPGIVLTGLIRRIQNKQ